jgi:hypothetical protein
MWIDIIHFCGLQKRGDVGPGPTAASGSCKQCILPSNCLRSDGALDNVGIDFDTPIAQEAFESGPPGDGVADRLGEFGFPGQARQFRFPQLEEPRHNGGGLFLAGFHPRCRNLAADVLLDLQSAAIVVIVCVASRELSFTCSS